MMTTLGKIITNNGRMITLNKIQIIYGFILRMKLNPKLIIYGEFGPMPIIILKKKLTNFMRKTLKLNK